MSEPIKGDTNRSLKNLNYNSEVGRQQGKGLGFRIAKLAHEKSEQGKMKCISIIQTGLLKKKQYSISLNVKNDTNKAQKLQGEFPRAKSRRYGDVDARSEHEKQSSSDEIGNKENKLTFNHLFKSKNLRRKLQQTIPIDGLEQFDNRNHLEKSEEAAEKILRRRFIQTQSRKKLGEAKREAGKNQSKQRQKKVRRAHERADTSPGEPNQSKRSQHRLAVHNIFEGNKFAQKQAKLNSTGKKLSLTETEGLLCEVKQGEQCPEKSGQTDQCFPTIDFSEIEEGTEHDSTFLSTAGQELMNIICTGDFFPQIKRPPEERKPKIDFEKLRRKFPENFFKL